MAEIKEAIPTKISAGNPVSRRCCESKDSRHVVKVFSKAGITQELGVKVEISCGFCIEETDTKVAMDHVL